MMETIEMLNYMIDPISGGLTVLTILMGLLVLIYWVKPAKRAIVSEDKISSEQWLILGVVIAFLGQSLDNSYWLVTWTANYINSESSVTRWLFDHGTSVNIPFRQISGIAAAYCHVYAAVNVNAIQTRQFKVFVLSASAAGVLFSLGMVFFKY